MKRTLLLTLVCAAGLLAGCAAHDDAPANSTPPTTTTPSVTPVAGEGLREGFDDQPRVPDGWSADAGEWRVEESPDAPSAAHVLHGKGGGGRSTLRAPSQYLDFDGTIRFQMIEGDEGAGLSFRYTPEGDYRIVRYSVREAGWHYFVMKAGQADKRNEATVDQAESAPALGEWVTLRVRAEGRHVQAWHDETLVIDITETEDGQAGMIGPFLRGSAEARFDDLHVEPISRS